MRAEKERPRKAKGKSKGDHESKGPPARAAGNGGEEAQGASPYFGHFIAAPCQHGGIAEYSANYGRAADTCASKRHIYRGGKRKPKRGIAASAQPLHLF